MTYQSGRQYSRLQQKILDRRGFKRGLTASGKHKTIESKHPPPGEKTLTMRLIEEKFKLPLEELLFAGTEDEVARKLGIARSTVSIWRKRLGVRRGWLWHRADESAGLPRTESSEASGDNPEGDTTSAE